MSEPRPGRKVSELGKPPPGNVRVIGHDPIPRSLVADRLNLYQGTVHHVHDGVYSVNATGNRPILGEGSTLSWLLVMDRREACQRLRSLQALRSHRQGAPLGMGRSSRPDSRGNDPRPPMPYHHLRPTGSPGSRDGRHQYSARRKPLRGELPTHALQGRACVHVGEHFDGGAEPQVPSLQERT